MKKNNCKMKSKTFKLSNKHKPLNTPEPQLMKIVKWILNTRKMMRKRKKKLNK